MAVAASALDDSGISKTSVILKTGFSRICATCRRFVIVIKYAEETKFNRPAANQQRYERTDEERLLAPTMP